MANTESEETPLTTDSWFIVKHLDTQHIYAQLIKNDFNEEYNGAIFKIKF